MKRFLRSLSVVALASLALSAVLCAQSTDPTTKRGAFLKTPEGLDVRGALRTPHVTNYDESKAGGYTLPDPLVMTTGQRVTDAASWERRRAEILELYRTEIFGKVPANAPRVTWEDAAPEPALNGAGSQRRLVGKFGDTADGPRMTVTLVLPATARGPVPVVLCVNFGAPAGRGGTTRAGATRAGASRPAATRGFAPLRGDPVADILAKGWGYASVGYTDIQPDRANTSTQGVIGQTLVPPQTQPAADQWGGVSAWAWGVSRIIDYFETDKVVDAKHIALMGHSRLGKTVLWAGAQDPRVACVFASCSGEMGAALSRRDWGETIDDMTETLAHQFAGNFQKYSGRWNDLPVDAHMLIALNAPHGVFITGGTGDQWADPKGEFLAAVAAGPVFRLLGKNDLGTTEFPGLDTPLITGDLGFVEHTGPHAATPADWAAFLEFASRYMTP